MNVNRLPVAVLATSALAFGGAQEAQADTTAQDVMACQDQALNTISLGGSTFATAELVALDVHGEALTPYCANLVLRHTATRELLSTDNGATFNPYTDEQKVSDRTDSFKISVTVPTYTPFTGGSVKQEAAVTAEANPAVYPNGDVAPKSRTILSPASEYITAATGNPVESTIDDKACIKEALYSFEGANSKYLNGKHPRLRQTVSAEAISADCQDDVDRTVQVQMLAGKKGHLKPLTANKTVSKSEGEYTKSVNQRVLRALKQGQYIQQVVRVIATPEHGGEAQTKVFRSATARS